MRCEVCGRTLPYKPLRVSIEGAKLLVCEDCAKHGTLDFKTAIEAVESPKKRVIVTPTPTISSPKRPPAPELDDHILVDDYGLLIRKAREERGWSQEELGKRINEKASIVGKIETAKLTPSLLITRKLEHVLNFSLLTKESASTPPPSPPQQYELTLGDVVTVKKQDKRYGEAESSSG